jgi:hypothetical protein
MKRASKISEEIDVGKSLFLLPVDFLELFPALVVCRFQFRVLTGKLLGPLRIESTSGDIDRPFYKATTSLDTLALVDPLIEDEGREGGLAMVEPMGFEPTTSSMPSRRAPNCATAPPITRFFFYSTRKCAGSNVLNGAHRLATFQSGSPRMGLPAFLPIR